MCIAITDIGMVTPAGLGLATAWEAIVTQTSQFKQNDRFGIEPLPYPVAGLVDYSLFPTDRRLMRMIRYHSSFILEALNQLKTMPVTKEDDGDWGMWFATTDHGLDFMEFLPAVVLTEDGHVDVAQFADRSERVLHPMFLLRELPNNGIGHASIRTGITGPGCNFIGPLAGIQAIQRAKLSVESEETAISIVGCYDSLVNYELLIDYHRMGMLTPTDVPLPEKMLKPFSKDRLGTIPAEGAIALSLESSEQAKKNGNPILGLIHHVVEVAEGNNLGAYESGSDVTKAITQALEECGLSAKDISLIFATGDGTTHNDSAEIHGIHRALGEFAYVIPIVSSKPIFGHMGTVAPVLDVVLACYSLQSKACPSTKNIVSPELPFRFADDSKLRPIEGSYGLVIGRTLAGHCAVVVVGT